MSTVSTELKNAVMSVMPDSIDEAMSSTAISRELGFTKNNKRVSDVVLALEEVGHITSKEQNGYKAYYTSEAGMEAWETGMYEGNGGARRIGNRRVPIELHDYNVVEGEEADTLIVVVPGDERTAITLDAAERLVVINQDAAYRFIVDSPEDVLEAIKVYTSEKGITTFVVEDMSTGAMISSDIDEEIDPEVAVIFLTVSRHNKAGV
ncbi:MAG: hypothetical protein KAS32_09180 [Candidatus Peribacteraceae bacterium]|nr:hypothetical protein [Candidatus Peribacteraceae bacterium]